MNVVSAAFAVKASGSKSGRSFDPFRDRCYCNHIYGNGSESLNFLQPVSSGCLVFRAPHEDDTKSPTVRRIYHDLVERQLWW